jgi:betaine reductase
MAKKAAEIHGKDDLIVILGSPDADSSELYAETLINGDPSWAGPLAGVALDLPVFHIMEPLIKEQIDPEVYKEHLELMAIALDVDAITQGLDRVRKKEA